VKSAEKKNKKYFFLLRYQHFNSLFFFITFAPAEIFIKAIEKKMRGGYAEIALPIPQ